MKDDPDLKGRRYIGEFIITQELIVLITPKASVRKVANTRIALLEA